MSKIPSYRRIIKTDYPSELQDSIEKLSFSINPAFEILFDILNKKLTLRDNLKCSVKEFITKVKTNGQPYNKITLPLDFLGPIDGCLVLNAINIKNPEQGVAGAPFISFTQNGNNIIINNIKGLHVDHEYSLKILIFGI